VPPQERLSHRPAPNLATTLLRVPQLAQFGWIDPWDAFTVAKAPNQATPNEF